MWDSSAGCASRRVARTAPVALWRMAACFGTALALGATSLAANAQERPSTILVLDASGSMWGQIQGVNKITIAREVVADRGAE